MSRRRVLRLLAVAALGVVLIIASAAPAGAHAVLENTDPLSNGAVERAPAQLKLSFSEPVEISASSVQVFDCTGGKASTGTPRHGAKSSEVVAELPDVPPSLYLVRWRVLSADAHPVQGAFYFRVGTGPDAASSPCATSAADAGGNTTVGVLFGAARVGVFAGLALLIGGTAFLVLIARG